MAEVQCHQRRVLVAEIVAHPFEVPLEVEILLDATDRSGRHLPRVGADVAPVLFPDVCAQPAFAQRGLEGVERGGGRDELLPEPPRPRPRHIAADVEEIQVATLDLVGHVTEIPREQHLVRRPDDVAELVRPRELLEVLGEADRLAVLHPEPPQAGELRSVFERRPRRRLHGPAVVIWMLGWLEQPRIDPSRRHGLGRHRAIRQREAHHHHAR